MFLSDLHTHSDLSIDGSETLIDIFNAALRRGLGAVAITDHWDSFPPGMRDRGYPPHNMDSRDFWQLRSAAHFDELFMLRERYAGRLTVSVGVELGQPQLDTPAVREFLKSRPFDFVLGAEHLAGDFRDYYVIDYQNADIDSLMRECFALENEAVGTGLIDALAHIDQPIRLMRGLGQDLSLNDYREEIATLLKTMITCGTALEINTHGLRNWYSRLSPPTWVLKLYRDLGGSFVTTGSDAHIAADIGAGILKATQLAKECGLTPVAYYRNREPVIIA